MSWEVTQKYKLCNIYQQFPSVSFKNYYKYTLWKFHFLTLFNGNNYSFHSFFLSNFILIILCSRNWIHPSRNYVRSVNYSKRSETEDKNLRWRNFIWYDIKSMYTEIIGLVFTYSVKVYCFTIFPFIAKPMFLFNVNVQKLIY